MAKNTLFILGDSTSMTIGCERHMYPFLMADQSCWPESTEFINCSQPGFTSADACAFFFRHRKEFPALKAVIIHLGTCDATSWEVRKGKYTPFRQGLIRAKEVLGIKKERTRLKNRLLPFEWNDSFDPAIEASESPEDYEFNLSRIVDSCVKSSIDVVMIRPKANPLFLPGVGKGNFIFYRYLGINERISGRLSISDSRFKEALELQESGDLSDAAGKYREILLNSGCLSFHSEYPLIVVNNYAVCAAEKGDLDEAESLFMLLLKERGARREIALFNLAEIYRVRGDKEKYRYYHAESYEADNSMYRIRSPYLAAIDRVSDRFGKGVHLVNIASFIEDHLYVDHTHPLKEGQERIAGRVINHLNKRGLAGNSIALVRNILYNPELALGNATEFFTYFRTYLPFSEEEITMYVEKLKSALLEDDSSGKASALLQELPRELKTALEYHMNHPCFPSLRFLIPFGPHYPSDVGRFPEYFLLRHLIPYLRLYEREKSINHLFSNDPGILRTSSELLSILPPGVIPLVPDMDPYFEPVIESQRLPTILELCNHKLLNHLRQGNQVYERMKTTIYWYFRETLRYGSHSRLSMRYDRTGLEYIAEALAVAAILDFRLNGGQKGEIAALIKILEETVRVHEYYSHQFTMSNHSGELLKEYTRRMFEIADLLENHTG